MPPIPPMPPGAPGVPGAPFAFPGIGSPGAGDDLRAALYERLLGQRTVVLDRPLDGDTATVVAAQLMTLDAEGADPITLLVNSPGGPLEAVATVLDTIDLVRGPIDTTCLGQAEGTAAVVVAAGTGHRRAGAGARLSLRLPQVELSGPASRLDQQVTQLGHLRDMVLDRLAAATGTDRRLLARDVDRGRTLNAEEAVTYGLVDELLTRRDRPDRPPPNP